MGLIAFWDEQNGLAAAGDVFYDHRGVVLVTHDGGETYDVALETDKPIASLRVDGTSDAVIGLNRISRTAGTADDEEYLRSRDGGMSWEPLGSRARGPSFSPEGVGLAVTGEPEFNWLDSLRSNIVKTTDDGDGWERIKDPCLDYWYVATQFVDGRHAWAFCAQEGGVGMQAKAVYISHDAGTHWRLRARIGLPHHRTHGGLSGLGYPIGMDFDPSGLAFLWGIEDPGEPAYVSRDGGATWKQLKGPHIKYGSITAASTAAGRTGFVLVSNALLRTDDGGRSFQLVRRFGSSVR